jgi:hypothetical protein
MMKKTILSASFLLLFATTLLVYPAGAGTKETAQKKTTAQADMMKLDSSMMERQQTGEKMQEATTATEREMLMQQHMQQMKDFMKMMKMMGKGGMIKSDKDEMMAKKIQMMMQMIGQMIMQAEMIMKE